MEKYKLPQELIQVDELPRNKMQKLDRKALVKASDLTLTHIATRRRIVSCFQNHVQKPIVNRLIRKCPA